jgi:hypothetical protein
MDVDDPAPPPPLVQLEPSTTSYSQTALPSDAVMSGLDHITQRIDSIDTFWRKQYQGAGK